MSERVEPGLAAARRPGPSSAGHPRFARGALTGGGPAGNEQLTAIVGVVLIVLLAVLGITILRIRQLISVHLFVGLLLLGPVALKMASTGYRFVRYYTRNGPYWHKGPPDLFMRAFAPVVVITTVVVFASGIVLLAVGPAGRGQWVGIHKASFVLWLVFMAVHVIGHLQRLPQSLRATRSIPGIPGSGAGAAGRWIAVTGTLVGGIVLAIILIPQFAAWTAPGAFPHFGDH